MLSQWPAMRVEMEETQSRVFHYCLKWQIVISLISSSCKVLAKSIFKRLVGKKTKAQTTTKQQIPTGGFVVVISTGENILLFFFFLRFLLLLLFTSSHQLFQFSYFKPNCTSELFQPDSFHLVAFPGSVWLLRVSWKHNSICSFPEQHDQPPSVAHQEWKEWVTFCELFFSWVVLSRSHRYCTDQFRSGQGVFAESSRTYRCYWCLAQFQYWLSGGLFWLGSGSSITEHHCTVRHLTQLVCKCIKGVWALAGTSTLGCFVFRWVFCILSLGKVFLPRVCDTFFGCCHVERSFHVQYPVFHMEMAACE